MTTLQTVLLSPIDAWFFRDGRPYNEGEGNQTDVISQFPPPATTLVGSLRAALARSHKWNGTGRWDSSLNVILGDGFDQLGVLSFRGPWLARTPDMGETELLFPMPLHVLGKPGQQQSDSEPRWKPACLLTPGHAVHCDLGEVCLPVMSEVRANDIDLNGLKEPASQWVTSRGLEQILAGRLPDVSQVVEARDLWSREARVGLKRCEDKRVTEQGALYSTRFVRLTRGVSLAMTIAGLPDGENWKIPDLLALGGEGRMADCRTLAAMSLPTAPVDQILASKRIVVTLITPLILPDSNGSDAGSVNSPQPNQTFFDWPGTTVVSACVGKPQSLGGWDSLERRPLPLRPVLSAGSTWFLEVTDASAIVERFARGIGMKTQYGFGQVVLGVWPSTQGDSVR